MDDHNPRKSKAFLITFIIVLILLLIGFFLFRNMKKSETKSTEEGGSNKIFESLFGTKKPKELTPVDTGTEPGGTVNPGTGGQTPVDPTDPNGGTGGNTGGGFGTGEFGSGGGLGSGGGFGITPPLDPITVPDEDDGWEGNNGGGLGDPIRDPIRPVDNTPRPIVEAYCPSDDPLVFTDAEKTELEALLKDYYAISYLLKTEDDIELLQGDLKTNTDLVARAETLNTQCIAQKADYRYSGPKTIKSNPYYNTAVDSITPYVPTYEILEELFKIW